MDRTLNPALVHEAAIAGITAQTDEYYVARFANGRERNRVLCLLALKNIIELIPSKVSDPGIARIKLAWWRDRSTSQAHPLIQFAEQFQLPIEQLLNACAILSESLDNEYLQDGFQNRQSREQWFEKSYLAFYQLLGDEPQLAARLEQARSLLSLRDEVRANIFRLPLDDLSSAGLDQDSLIASPNSEEVREFLVTELASAGTNLSSALEARNHRRSPLRTYAELTLRRVRETARDGGHLFARKVDLTPIRKILIAWRCSLL